MLPLFLTITMYHLVPVTFPAWAGSPSPDTGAAIAINGNVAARLQGDGRSTRIGILRSDGSTTLLSLPSAATIARQIEVESPPGFAALALAQDGTPFATVGSCFEAVGGGGCREALFVWNGAWHPVARPQSDDQFAYVSAESMTNYLLEDDFSERSAVGESGGLPAPGAYWYRGKEHPYLPALAAAALRGRYVVGTESYAIPDPNAPTPTASPTPTIPHAIEFAGTTRTLLGVGVANAVNASGEAVGDDEPHPGASGSPTLWSGGHAILLSAAKGTADAINDAGLIAGTAGGHTFLTDEHDPKHRVYAIDDLIVEKTWHVDKEYGIDAHGRILAFAHRTRGAQRLVLLEPIPSTRP